MLPRSWIRTRAFSWVVASAVIAAVLAVGRFTPSGGSRTLGRLPDDERLHAVFLDVGQGDAILIRTPSGDDILVDGGPDDTVASKLDAALPAGDRDIELLILTHPHADHLVGFHEVLRRYAVRRVAMTGVLHTTDTYLSFLREVRDRGIPTFAPRAGDALSFGGATLEFLWPDHDLSGERVSEPGPGEPGGLNDTSIVFRLRYGRAAMLFTGDATSAVEKRLIASASSTLTSDLLKVGHHGSKYSTTREFLGAVHPRFAVISVGAKNRYGHPSARVIKRLRDAGVATFRTDENGDVRADSDGETISVTGLRKDLAPARAF